jgi:hypothetical protein
MPLSALLASVEERGGEVTHATAGEARENAGSADCSARDISIPGPRRRSGITVPTRDIR